MTAKSHKSQKGFTLVEILVVIAIIGILALIVVVALNPVARFQDARNTTRKSNVDTLLQAFRLYAVDNNGNYPTGIPTLQTGDFSSGEPYCTPAVATSTASCAALSDSAAPGSSLVGGSGQKSYVQTIPADTPYNGTGAADSSTYYVGETNDKQHVVVFSANMEPGTSNQGVVFYEEN